MRKTHPIFAKDRWRKYIPKVVSFFEQHKEESLRALNDFPLEIQMFKKPIYVKNGDEIKIVDYVPFTGIAEFGLVEDTVVLEYQGNRYELDASVAYLLFVNDKEVRDAIKDKLDRTIERAKEEENREYTPSTTESNDDNTFSPFSDVCPDAHPSSELLGSLATENPESQNYFEERGKAMALAMVEASSSSDTQNAGEKQ